MKTKIALLISVLVIAVLVFVIFVPVLPQTVTAYLPCRNSSSCYGQIVVNQNASVSISYHFLGFGGIVAPSNNGSYSLSG